MTDTPSASDDEFVHHPIASTSQYSIDVGDDDVVFRLTRKPRTPRKRRSRDSGVHISGHARSSASHEEQAEQAEISRVSRGRSRVSRASADVETKEEKLKRIQDEIREESKIDFEALGLNDEVGYGKNQSRIETRERLLTQLHILREGLEGVIQIPHYPDDTPIERLVYIRDSFTKIVRVRKYVKSSRKKLLFAIGFIEAIARRYHVPLNKFAKIQALCMKKYDKYLIRLAEENMIEGYGEDDSTYGMIKEIATDAMTSFGVNILGKYLDRDKSEHIIELLLASMSDCEEDDLLMKVEKGEAFFSDIDPDNKKAFSELIVEIADIAPQLCEKIPKLKSLGPMISFGMNLFKGKGGGDKKEAPAPRKRQRPGM